MKFKLKKIGVALAGSTLVMTMAFNAVSAGTFRVTSVPYASATRVNKTKTTDTKKIGCTAKLNNSKLLAPTVKAKEDAGTKTENYYSGKSGNKGKKIIVSYRDSTGTGFGSFNTDTTINYY